MKTIEKSDFFEGLESRVLLSANAALPELSLTATMRTQNLNPQDDVVATVVLRNTGNVAAGAFDTSLALSASGVFGDADNSPLATIPEASLAAHSRLKPSGLALTIPAGIPAGQYHLVGKIDVGNTVVERNENNNVFSTRTLVRVGAVVSVTASPRSVTPAGPPIQFTITRNNTSLAAPLVVNYAVTGTAVPGTDFATPSGTVTIEAGKRSAVVTIAPLSTTVLSLQNKSITLTLSPGSDYNVVSGRRASATVIINNQAALASGGLMVLPGATGSTLLVTPVVSPLSFSNAITPLPATATLPVGTPAVVVPFRLTSLTNVGALNFNAFTPLTTPLVVQQGTPFGLIPMTGLIPQLFNTTVVVPQSTAQTQNLAPASAFFASVGNPAPLLPNDLQATQFNTPLIDQFGMV